MSRVRTAMLAAAATAALVWSAPADAAAQLGLGADYWTEPELGLFQLTLAVDTPLARRTTLGARFGALVTSGPNDVGVPLDLRLRIRTRSGLYLEGLAGPWLFFDDSDDWLRAHAAFGFGLVSRDLSFGLEVGYLDPSAIVGIRVGFRL